MEKVLNVFLSYKMAKYEEGDDDKVDIAKEIADILQTYSAGKIIVHYAGIFKPGHDWRDELINTIKKCDIFVLLYTGSDQQWEFCLLEAGLFQASRPKNPLVVLHNRDVARPSALSQLESVHVTAADLAKFLRPIFLDEPWRISPLLSSQKIDEIATVLVHKFNLSNKISTNFDLVPNFTFEMSSSEKTHEFLRLGQLPDHTLIKGAQEWQILFDRGTANKIIKWEDLSTWPVKNLYNIKFSRMLLSAIKKDTPGGCFIRPALNGESNKLYRIALRRYEEYANDTGWKFYFTAAPIDIPIFGIGDTASEEELRAYHLLNVTWYTRRRLIDQLYTKAQALASASKPTKSEVTELAAEIRDEIASISIQTYIRNINHPMDLGNILPLREVQDDEAIWQECVENILQQTNGIDIAVISKRLFQLGKINRKYYILSAKEFSKTATKLRQPRQAIGATSKKPVAARRSPQQATSPEECNG